MPRHAPALECSAEDKAGLIGIRKSRIEEARLVERGRIILARLEGQADSASGAGVGGLRLHGRQVVQAIFPVGDEWVARRSAIR